MSGGTASGRRQAIQAGACGPGSACAGRGRRSLGNALTRMQPRCDRSMSGYDKDLAGWMPRLIAVWRKARRAPRGPPDRLTPPEMKEIAAAVRRLSLGLTRERALAVRQWDPLSRRGLPEGEFDLIALGHVLNELFGADEGALSGRAALVEEALGRVRRGGGVVHLPP